MQAKQRSSRFCMEKKSDYAMEIMRRQLGAISEQLVKDIGEALFVHHTLWRML